MTAKQAKDRVFLMDIVLARIVIQEIFPNIRTSLPSQKHPRPWYYIIFSSNKKREIDIQGVL
jgi:hypothetical protein